MRPEFPFLAAGGVTLVGATARRKGIPSNAGGAIVATVALVLLASMTTGTKLAPVVRAIGFLLLLTSIMAAVPAFSTRITKSKRK